LFDQAQQPAAPETAKSPRGKPRQPAEEGPAPEAAPTPRPPPRATAESLATRQRDISVSEFFVKNRHLLGFDNPQKALLTAVRECVDNSLDACSDAGLLPTLRIEIRQLADDRYRISVQDDGPGIVRTQIPKIFGKLLYGSKFHILKQQRGQQGIGVSAAGMYGQLTVDTKRNQPLVSKDEKCDWEAKHGTRVEIDLQAVYKKGRRSVDDYVEQTALANPHAEIFYTPPNQEIVHYARAVSEVPEEPREIRPHPHGVELGMLMRMLKDTPSRALSAALKSDFCRVTDRVVGEIVKAAGLSPTSPPRRLSRAQVERLHTTLQSVKLLSPPTNCLSPIGEEAIEAGLRKRFEADHFETVTRPPAVYRGNPFQVEVGLAYGGKLPAEDLVDLFRLANRVPLQYQASGCAISKAVMTVDWRSYGLSMSRGALPSGPMVLMVHVVSVWVPFTSESKEAVANYPEIVKELRLALMEVGRKLGAHIRRRRRAAAEEQKKSYIDQFIPHIGIGLKEILALSDRQEAKLLKVLRNTLERSREKLG